MAARLRLTDAQDEGTSLECEVEEGKEIERAVAAVWQGPHAANGALGLASDKKSGRCRIPISQVQMDAEMIGIIIVGFTDQTQRIYPLIRRISAAEDWMELQGFDADEDFVVPSTADPR